MINSSPTQTPGSAIRFTALFVGILCVALYGPALGGPLFFDDIPNLVDNTLVQISGDAFDAWRAAALSTSAGALERPVSMLTFAVNHVVAGEFSSLALKSTNLAIHLITGGLVYWLALLVMSTPAMANRGPEGFSVPAVAMLAAFLWLLHPLHVSTVMYGVQRMAQLATLFTLAGLVVYLRYRLRWARYGSEPAEVPAAVLWIGLLGLLALLSKENGALLPWLIVAIEVALLEARWAGQYHRGAARAAWMLLLLPVVLLVAVFVVAPEWVLDRYLTREFTLQERLLTQARVLWSYVGWTFAPSVTHLGFFHDDIALSRGLFQPMTTVLAILAWIVALGSSLLSRRRYPLFFFALVFYLVAHSMESSVIPLEMVFEHRNYLPSVALVILAAHALLLLGVRLGTRARLAPAVVAVLALSLLLGIRAYVWRDDTALARFNVVNHPQSPRANFYYANALYGQFVQASARGLDEEARVALAVSARQYYQAMHTLDSRDLAPLVMLYQLDSRHFPALAMEHDWLQKIESLAGSRRLQRSDTTALGALVASVIGGGREADRLRVDVLLGNLRARFPDSVGLVALHFRLMQEGGEARREELRAMLEGLLERKPGNRKAAAYLAQFHGSENLPATYAAVARWLANDTQAQEIAEIRAVFGP